MTIWPGDHIGKQPDAEREGFREKPQDFNHEHERHQPEGQTGRNKGMQVMARNPAPITPENIDHQKGGQGHPGRHGDIAGRGRAKRDQPQQIAEKDKEEEREKIGKVFVAGIAQVRTHDFIADVDDKDFKQIGPAAGSASLRPAGGGLAPRDQKHHQKKGAGNRHHQIMGREINRRRGRS